MIMGVSNALPAFGPESRHRIDPAPRVAAGTFGFIKVALLTCSPNILEFMPRKPELHERTDADLVEACRRGEARAWHELVHRYRHLVFGIPRAMGLQPADADEVFQQTFTELLRALGRLRDPSRLEAWLVTASRRGALRLKRDERRRRLAEQDMTGAGPDRTAPAADEAIERLREGERVLRALESLAEPCRSLLSGLFADAAPSYRALAARLGLAVGSLGATRARCLQRLRQKLLRGRGSQLSVGFGDPASGRGRS